jgi:RNA polymerase sigma factor (sigma-70 family)
MPTVHANRFLPALKRVVLVREIADRTDGQLLTAFIRERDGDAFAALVRRHGAMVLGVCRRVTGNADTADDAFQAVFLILARRASAVRSREQVGNWLYGVAFRTAIKARTVLARRRSREKQVLTMPEPPAPPTTDNWSELQPVIDEELARLPEKFRIPVVLCDLEGRPQRAVAKHLGVAPATLATRLAAARRTLASRLARRGVTLSGGALATVLGTRASAAAVSPKLADVVIRAAEAVAGGTGLTGLVSAHAVQLCEGVMRIMLLSKLKAMGAVALAMLALTGSLGFGLMPAWADDEPKTTQAIPARQSGTATSRPQEPLDDAAFLRRVCLDLTGVLPSPVEMNYFTSDRDPKKRRKVVEWLLDADMVRKYLAKKLKVPIDQIRVIAETDSKTGRVYHLAIVSSADAHSEQIRTTTRSWLKEVAPYAGAHVRIVGQERYYPLVGRGTVLADFDSDGFLDLQIDGQPQPAHGRGTVLADLDNDGWPDLLVVGPKPTEFQLKVRSVDSDAEFLNRVIQSARGSAPTALEEKYFAEDKDPKKREKLLDLLLKDPVVAKKLGDDWKKKMLEPPTPKAAEALNYYRLTVKEYVTKVKPDRFEKLLGELLEAKKTDEQVLEAVTLAVLGRLPTVEEKRATLAVIGTAQDRKAAWLGIAKAYAASDEGKKHAGALNPNPTSPPKK